MVKRSPGGLSLRLVRSLARKDRFVLTGRALRYLVTQSWDRETVAQGLCSLERIDLHKSIPDSRRPGSLLDVYRPWMDGQRLYIKFTLDEDGDLYVLSFCRDGENH
jgi:hypothetical protein